MKKSGLSNILYASLFSLVLIIGMYLGFKFHDELMGYVLHSKSGNINQVIRLIDKKYVDSVDMKLFEEESIQDMLSRLDPHSVYIPAEDVARANETLEGNFEGIGIEFYLLKDTIYVVSAIHDGPSEKLGIKSGDRIVTIDGENVAGKKIKNSDVTSKLRGEGGTVVKVGILRPGNKKIQTYSITRGTIPIHSVDVYYMLTKQIGYIKISSFGSTTYDEFTEALSSLKKDGMKDMVLDLRGNPGGYLSTAIKIADEFLSDKKLILYTEGKASPRHSEYASTEGSFEEGKLVILIDEGSASASEIVAGAIQDWDRGNIVGRRSFGKGLVQEQARLADGSSLRLTIARYYTPTGRCIQKPYNEGLEAYEADVYNRYVHGELNSLDSSKRAPKQKAFKTPSGKVVYDGGGISPDVFVPMDTGNYSTFYGNVVSTGLMTEFIYQLNEGQIKEIKKWGNAEKFNNGYKISMQMWRDFLLYADSKGLKPTKNDLVKSENTLKTQIKALIGRQYYKSKAYYMSMQELDKALMKSIEVISAK